MKNEGKKAADKDLHTEAPISEKDEVKQAEEKLNKNTDKKSVATEPKIRESGKGK